MIQNNHWTVMDSQEDAAKQLEQQTPGLHESSSDATDLFQNISSPFCDNLFCLGEVWHEWGCCSNKKAADNCHLTLPIPPSSSSSSSLPAQQNTNVHGCGSENYCTGALSAATTTTATKRFALPKTEEDLPKAWIESIPKKACKYTSYCVRLWASWSDDRATTTGIPVPPLAVLSASAQDLQYWLIRFIHEIQKKNSLEYPPNTLHRIVSGIMRHIRHDCGQLEVDFFKDPEFSDFRSSLDTEMKHLQSAGLGYERKQAEPFSLEEEELLWEKILGDHNPKSLLNTIMFMNGFYFALRSGAEHCQLHHNPCQIQLVEKPG